MHRQPLLEALDAYLVRYPREQAVVAQFHEFVAAHSDCFERALSHPGHVTGSAWIMDPDGGAVLLTHHRKLDLWVQLGGHADGDPDVLAVAWREGLEESGLASIDPVAPAAVPFDLDIHEIPARKREPAHLHYDVRFAFRARSRDVRVGDESHDLAWVPLDDLAAYGADESVLRMAAKWRQRAASV